MRIGDLLKLWMRVNKYTMQELAYELDVSKATVSRICSGKTVDSETLLRLIEYFFRAR